MDGAPTPDAARALAAGTLREFTRLVPALQHLRVEHVDAGVIFLWGSTDNDDPHSELHQRHAIGVHAHDGWISIDTGKLTTAPLFAQRLLDQL